MKPAKTAQAASKKNANPSKKNLTPVPEKALDSLPALPVSSETPAAIAAPATSKENKMTLEFKHAPGARKDSRYVIFEFADGRQGSVQFLRSAFPGKATEEDGIPATITMEGDFAVKTVRIPKAAETAEERKARIAALPKLTPAEKLAKAEEKVAKLRAKVASATQPEAVPA